MSTPEYRQLVGVLDLLYDAIRGDEVFAQHMNVAPETMLRSAHPFKLLYTDDAGKMRCYNAELPALAIYPTKWTAQGVAGSPGQRASMGLQYLFRPPTSSPGSLAEASVMFVSHLVWVRMCHWLRRGRVENDASETYPNTQRPLSLEAAGIREVELGSATPLQPLEKLTGFEADLTLHYCAPPYTRAGAQPLEHIYGSYYIDGTPHVLLTEGDKDLS